MPVAPLAQHRRHRRQQRRRALDREARFVAPIHLEPVDLGFELHDLAEHITDAQHEDAEDHAVEDGIGEKGPLERRVKRARDHNDRDDEHGHAGEVALRLGHR